MQMYVCVQADTITYRCYKGMNQREAWICRAKDVMGFFRGDEQVAQHNSSIQLADKHTHNIFKKLKCILLSTEHKWKLIKT